MQIHLTREKSVDVLRGMAVLLMIAAHAIAYFYEGSNPLINFVRTFGDITAFVMFVFVAGATTYFAYLDYPNNKIHSIKANRIIRLLMEYYFVAFVSSLENLFRLPFEAWPALIAKIFFLIEIPDYTEFILTFVLFTAVLYITQNKLNLIFKSKLKLISIAILSYFLGYIIYIYFNIYPLTYWTSLIAGHADWFRFPVLQYLPVLLAGIYVGKLIDKDYPYHLKKKRLIWLIILSSATVIICLIFPKLSIIPYYFEFNRWPPSIGFLSIGITTSLISTALLTLQNPWKFRVPDMVETIFTTLGHYALAFFTVHIVLFEIADLLFPNSTTENPLTIIFIIILSIILCYSIIKISGYISLKPK